MINLSALTNNEILFTQPSFFKDQYQLMFNEEIIGTLAIPRFFSRDAVIELFEKKWELKRTSFWRSEYGIFKYGYELPIAVFKRKFSGGTIELHKGISLQVKMNLWKGITEIISKNGRRIITSKNKAGIKEKLIITVNNAESILEENPWLLMLPGYIAINRRKTAAHGG